MRKRVYDGSCHLQGWSEKKMVPGPRYPKFDDTFQRLVLLRGKREEPRGQYELQRAPRAGGYGSLEVWAAVVPASSAAVGTKASGSWEQSRGDVVERDGLGAGGDVGSVTAWMAPATCGAQLTGAEEPVRVALGGGPYVVRIRCGSGRRSWRGKTGTTRFQSGW